jgi:hypothetical protein
VYRKEVVINLLEIVLIIGVVGVEVLLGALAVAMCVFGPKTVIQGLVALEEHLVEMQDSMWERFERQFLIKK